MEEIFVWVAAIKSFRDFFFLRQDFLQSSPLSYFDVRYFSICDFDFAFL